ncbi:hypothetical protein KBB85_01370 [Patescibacteria group bacterium]|nr:hypothetical protein [Patescibacteria group bacterium]
MNLSCLLSHPLFVPFTVQVILAYEWLSSGWEKVRGGQFVPNIGKSLARFENGNPHEWYVRSVLGVAKSHPTVFSMLVQWGELLAGVGLLAALVLYAFSKQQSSKNLARFIAVAALLGGAFMNLNFYFAAGWTSPSTGGLNALMFWVQVVLLAAWAIVLRKDQKTAVISR